MTQSAGSDRDITIMGLDVFWPQTTANPPMRWNDWLIEFHMAALAEEALHLDTIITAEALTPAPDNIHHNQEQCSSGCRQQKG